MKPRRGWTHPLVMEDFDPLLGSVDALRAGAASGFTLIHNVWFVDGVPEDLWKPQDWVNGFDLTVIDEFGVTWLLGWQERREELVLFAARPMDAGYSAAQIIQMYRGRVEVPEL